MNKQYTTEKLQRPHSKWEFDKKKFMANAQKILLLEKKYKKEQHQTESY